MQPPPPRHPHPHPHPPLWFQFHQTHELFENILSPTGIIAGMEIISRVLSLNQDVFIISYVLPVFGLLLWNFAVLTTFDTLFVVSSPLFCLLTLNKIKCVLICSAPLFSLKKKNKVCQLITIIGAKSYECQIRSKLSLVLRYRCCLVAICHFFLQLIRTLLWLSRESQFSCSVSVHIC